jgi:hypothetical protein
MRRAAEPQPDEETVRLLGLYRDRVESYPDAPADYQQRWSSWCRTLLERGGQLVVPPPAPDPCLDRLLAGPVMHRAGPAAQFIAGEPSACHANASHLWVEQHTTGIGTGYALSPDGLWRSHSWGVGVRGELTETTEQRDAYSGVIRTGTDALIFVCSNNLEALEDALARGGPRAEQLLNMMDEILDRHQAS